MAKKSLRDELKTLQIQHAQTRGGVNTTAAGIELTFRKQRLTRRLVYGVIIYMGATGPLMSHYGATLAPTHAVVLSVGSIAAFYAYDWAAAKVRSFRRG